MLRFAVLCVVGLLMCGGNAQVIGWKPMKSGLNGRLNCGARYGTSAIVGGSFSKAGGVDVSNIAMWDGGEWHALGGGVNGDVEDLVVIEDRVFVGGSFQAAGGVFSSRAALWDGSTWSALGGGLNGDVHAVASDGANVFFGGEFLMAGGAEARRVAMWNGSNWSALGGGVNGSVYAALVLSSTEVIFGGNFTEAGGKAVVNVAMWDGSVFSPMGKGIKGDSVYVLASSGGAVYAGGHFWIVDDQSASNIAKWNGASWQPLSTGTNGPVFGLVVLGEDLFVGGNFTRAGGQNANNLAVWTGSTWNSVGVGIGEGQVSSLWAVNTEIFVGGIFSSAGGQDANNVAMSIQVLNSLGQGLDNAVLAFATVGSDLYVGGSFAKAGGIVANGVARWDGQEWHALGSGVDDTVWCLVPTSNGDVVVGGSFTFAGGKPSSNIALWNGVGWESLGGGVNDEVSALLMVGSSVIVGGVFTEAGGVEANSIAMWDGSTWSALGGGLNGGVYALAWDGEDLIYVGGRFSMAGGSNASHIAMWDGAEWSSLGDGVATTEGGVFALLMLDGVLLVGGFFREAGNVSANSLAIWDGDSWDVFGEDGVHGTVMSLAAFGSDVYVGGDFTEAGADDANGLAVWDGGLWHAFGDGVDGVVNSLVVVDSVVYMGGDFDQAAGIQINHAASASTRRPPDRLAEPLVTNAHPTAGPGQLDARIALAIALGAGVFCAVSLSVAARYFGRVAEILETVDFFTLDHFTPKGTSPVSKTTSFGGSMSVAMVVTILGITINTAISYLDSDPISSSGFHPESRISMDPNATGWAQIAVVFQSPWMVQCPEPLLNAPTGWDISTKTLPASTSNTTDCAFVIECAECSMQTASTVSLTVPYWFMWGSWATSTKGASLLSGNASYDVFSGVWNRPSPSSFAEQVTVQLSVTKDLQTKGSNTPATGLVSTFTAQSQKETTFGSSTTLSVEFVPSGLVFLTSYEESSAAAGEAWSVIIGGAGGMLQVFRVLVPLFEWFWIQCHGGRRKTTIAMKPPDENLELAEPLLNDRPTRSNTVHEWPRTTTP